MSCIIAIAEEDAIYIGADGQATSENGEIRPIFCNKLIVNGDYVFGYTGSIRSGQILKSTIFDPPDDINLLGEYIRMLYKESGLVIQGDSGDQCSSNLIIIHKGKIYEMLIDFQINEPFYDFLAVGSGSNYAFGSLHSCSNIGLTAEERILLALDAAIEFDGMCGYPIFIRKFEL